MTINKKSAWLYRIEESRSHQIFISRKIFFITPNDFESKSNFVILIYIFDKKLKNEVSFLFEFCEKCGSIMMPSKEDEREFLVCTLCKHQKEITEEIHESYVF